MAACCHNRVTTRKRALTVSAAVCAALAVGSCQSAGGRHGTLFGGESSPEITGSIDGSQASLASVSKLAEKWRKDPSDPRAAMVYADQLDGIGSKAQALDVLRETWQRRPDSPALAAAYGRRLASAGQLPEASQVLEKALGLGADKDWRVHSALGTVYDGLDRHEKAQQHYAAGLRLKPNHTPILNNLGMSYALAGDLKKAEAVLRQAMANDDRNTTIRQNVALIVGLQGRFADAEKIVSKDLPPDLVAANIAYLRAMLSQSNVWDALKDNRPVKAAAKTTD